MSDSYDDSLSDISIMNATAKWPGQYETAFSNLSIKIEPGSLVGVIGPVGSGKSSLFSLFLNELDGYQCEFGELAYVPQEAWIFGGTIRENILIGRKFDSKLYQSVVQVCSLISDFSNFPDRDQTLVGEKGVTLSGGQRARINLARAAYGDENIFLLDDPLAAVDTKVVNDLYSNAICGYLKNKTRILVTHHLNLLSNADQIICFKDRKIVFNGKFEEIKYSDDEFLRKMINTDVIEPVIESETEPNPKSTSADFIQDNQKEFLKVEEKKTGKLGIRSGFEIHPGSRWKW